MGNDAESVAGASAARLGSRSERRPKARGESQQLNRDNRNERGTPPSPFTSPSTRLRKHVAGCPQGRWNRGCARAGGSYRGGADWVETEESVARCRGTQVGRKVAASTTGCWSCGTARRSRALRKEKGGLCRQLMTSPLLEVTNTPLPTTLAEQPHSLFCRGKKTARDLCQIWNKKASCGLKRSGTLRAKYIPNGRFSRRGESCFIEKIKISS